jgi:hypothetical protein
VGPATGHNLIDGGGITVPDARLFGRMENGLRRVMVLRQLLKFGTILHNWQKVMIRNCSVL